MMHHKKSVLVLALTGLLLHGVCLAATPVSDAVTESPEFSSVQSALSKGDAGGVRLADWVAQIENDHGVPIRLSKQLVNDTAEVGGKAADQQSALQALLREYDHLAIIGRDGNYRRIWLTARRIAEPAKGSESIGGLTHTATQGAYQEPNSKTDFPTPIWQPVDVGEDSLLSREGILHESIQIDPGFFEALEVGKPIEIPIPQESEPYFAVVGETHNELGGAVQVWSGPIDGSHETASFTMTRGRTSTYVTVATGSSIYEAVVDNVTGVGALVNEVDLTKDKIEHEHLVPSEAGAATE